MSLIAGVHAALFFQFKGINEVRGVKHQVCHDNVMNESMYALEFIPTGFQIYTHHKAQIVSLG